MTLAQRLAGFTATRGSSMSNNAYQFHFAALCFLELAQGTTQRNPNQNTRTASLPPCVDERGPHVQK